MGYLKAPKINTSARMTSAWASSELLYDTDLNAFYKGDGTTTGGVRLAEGDMASVLAVISALEARVSTLSATPPSVSVTSTKLSNAISNVKSVINIVSNNLSVVNAARVSSENVISNAVSVVSNALSVETQTRSAQVASVNNVVSNLQSVVGAIGANSVTSGEIVSIVSTINVSIAAVSNAISVVSNAVSVVSNALSVETAARVSAVNALSNQVSQALSLISAKNLSLIVSVGNSTSLEIQVSGVRTPHIQFDPSVSTPTTSVYSLSKDVTFNLLNYQALSALGIIIPQDDVWAVKNQSGSTILKGSPVMAVGTVGASGRILVDHMVADGTVSPKFLLGVAAHDMATGDDGYVLKKGKIKKLNTNAWPSGTVLYCDPATPGGFTSTIPQAPNLKLPVAFVVYQDTTNGIIAVRVTEGARLSEDHDIELVSVTDGQLLKYNLSAKRWENWTPTYASTNDLSVVSAQAASAINVVSNALSIEIASRTSADTALSNAISAVSAQAASAINVVSVAAANALSVANVVSNAVSIVSVNAANALSVANAASNAVSVEIVNRTNADGTLSSAITLVSNAASNALSVANAASNAVSLEIVNRVSADNVLSVAIHAVSNAVSVEIVNRTSADNVLSLAINVVSNAASNALSVANAASNAASVVSNALSNAISNFRSADNVLSNQISVVSVAAANALSVANVVSNAVSVVSVALANEISARAAADTNILSVISVLNAKVNVSAINQAGTSVKGLQSVINALSNRISALSGASPGAVSVTSTELSAVSAQAASAINVISAQLANVSAVNTSATAVAGLQSVINALSNRISAVSSTNGSVVKVLANDFTQRGPANTTSPTAVMSYTIPANTLAAGDMFQAILQGVYKQASGSSVNCIVRVKFGGSTVASGTLAVANSTPERTGGYNLIIVAEDSTNQHFYLTGFGAGGSATALLAAYNGSTPFSGGFYTKLTGVSLASNQTLEIEFEWATANANVYGYGRAAAFIKYPAP